jgi:signal transduction histidine kinase
MAITLYQGWEEQIEGVIVAIGFGGINLLTGSYAHLIQQADLRRQKNQRLLSELQTAYRQLQENAAQVEEMATAQERSRMARELHDSVTQTIFSMNLTVQAARLLVEKDPVRVVEQIDRLQELARSAVGEIQVLVSQLRQNSAAVEGLPAALRRLAAERHQRDGLQVSLEINGDRLLPAPVVEGLFRIAQEALNNVAKHSGSTEAMVRLDLNSMPACLEIEDHGRGFHVEQYVRRPDHVGLAGMTERARELGWTLEVITQPGRGTHLLVREDLTGKTNWLDFENSPAPEAAA